MVGLSKKRCMCRTLPSEAAMAKTGSIKGKLLAGALGTTVFLAASSMAVVTWSLSTAANDAQAQTEQQLTRHLESKGRLLAGSHALALRGLASDNAFSDVKGLVQRAVDEDDDVIYGQYVDANGKVWAHVSPTATTSDADKASELPTFDLPAKATDRRTNVYNTDVLEVAAPVIVDDEVIGAVRYGLSLQAMRALIDADKAESEAALKRTIAMLAMAILSLSVVTVAASRKTAMSISGPVERIADAARALAGGSRTVQVDVKTGDEIEVLGDSFNKMVRDLDETYRSLETLNKTLESKVEERTAELQERNREMRAVLDNIDQGLVMLDATGKMGPQRSAAFSRWLGAGRGVDSFEELLTASDNSAGVNFGLAFQQCQENMLPLDCSLDMLPRKAVVGERTLDIRYLPFTESNGALQNLLVVLTDATERLAHAAAEASQRETLAIMRGVVRDRAEYERFLADLLQRTSTLHDVVDDEVTFKREAHTIKGNAAVYGLERVASMCHALEDDVADGTAPAAALARYAEPLRELIHVAYATARTLGLGRPQLEVHPDELEGALQKLRAGHIDETVDVLTSWYDDPAERHLQRLGDAGRAIVAKLGKGDLRVVVDSHIRLPRRYDTIWSVLSHLVRNAADHGLESVNERVAAGKTDEPTFILSARRSDNEVVIAIADNGRGIHWAAVRASAQKKGLPSSTERDLIDALFSDGMSTAQALSSLSGRGVGLSAVKEAVVAAGGRIEIASEAGRGTTFSLHFPEASAVKEAA